MMVPIETTYFLVAPPLYALPSIFEWCSLLGCLSANIIMKGSFTGRFFWTRVGGFLVPYIGLGCIVAFLLHTFLGLVLHVPSGAMKVLPHAHRGSHGRAHCLRNAETYTHGQAQRTQVSSSYSAPLLLLFVWIILSILSVGRSVLLLSHSLFSRCCYWGLCGGEEIV